MRNPDTTSTDYRYLLLRLANRLPALVPSPAPTDSWLVKAVTATDNALRVLVEEFLQDPYLHRVEHSLHARPHALLLLQDVLNQRVPLASGQVTQLVHKEWPETVARKASDRLRPRGLFDLVVLSPDQVGQASLEQFRAGRISAPIVIEVGLDYGLPHLRQDAGKLMNSKVVCPYVVHLSRIAVRDEAAIEAFLTSSTAGGLKAAYVHRDPGTGRTRYKHLDTAKVSTYEKAGASLSGWHPQGPR